MAELLVKKMIGNNNPSKKKVIEFKILQYLQSQNVLN